MTSATSLSLSKEPLLQVVDLQLAFSTNQGVSPAVLGISFSLNKGSTLALVGESGSGKSVTALSMTRLLPSPPLLYQGGHVFFQGVDLLSLSEKKLRKYRWRRIAYVFQEASRSLNPLYSIRSQLAETLKLHRPDLPTSDREILPWLDMVGIARPQECLQSYPHQLSGGMQQRVMIAMALCAQPDLLIADEPTTALDVTIQAQILTLLQRLQKELGMTLLFITHNLAIVSSLAHHVAVMHQGRLVEYGATEKVLRNPEHPYTRALLACIPRLDRKLKRLPTIGNVGKQH